MVKNRPSLLANALKDDNEGGRAWFLLFVTGSVSAIIRVFDPLT